MRSPRLWVSLAVVLAWMYGPHAFASCAALKLEVTPTVAEEGQRVALSGYGLCDDTGPRQGCERRADGPQQDVRLTVDGKDYRIGTARARHNGKGDHVTLPEGVSGSGTITLLDRDGKPFLSAPITITPG